MSHPSAVPNTMANLSAATRVAKRTRRYVVKFFITAYKNNLRNTEVGNSVLHTIKVKGHSQHFYFNQKTEDRFRMLFRVFLVFMVLGK